MNFARLVIISCVVFAFTACQKEVSLDSGVDSSGNPGGGGGGGGTAGDLLTKQVINTFFDTTTINYVYNSNKKLIGQTVKVVGPLSDGDFRRHITRDASGRVTFVKDSSYDISAGVWDTAAVSVFYNGSTNTALYAISSTAPNAKDSIVFTYTGNNITKVSMYQYSSGTYDLYKEFVYTYDAAGNILSSKYSLLDGSTGNLELMEENKLLYDNKVSPFKMGAESVLLSAFETIGMGEGAAGPNNVTSTEFTDHDTGTTVLSTASYTYGGNGKPTKATTSYKPSGSPVGLPGSIDFFY